LGACKNTAVIAVQVGHPPKKKLDQIYAATIIYHQADLWRSAIGHSKGWQSWPTIEMTMMTTTTKRPTDMLTGVGDRI